MGTTEEFALCTQRDCVQLSFTQISSPLSRFHLTPMRAFVVAVIVLSLGALCTAVDRPPLCDTVRESILVDTKEANVTCVIPLPAGTHSTALLRIPFAVSGDYSAFVVVRRLQSLLKAEFHSAVPLFTPVYLLWAGRRLMAPKHKLNSYSVIILTRRCV